MSYSMDWLNNTINYFQQGYVVQGIWYAGTAILTTPVFFTLITSGFLSIFYFRGGVIAAAAFLVAAGVFTAILNPPEAHTLYAIIVLLGTVVAFVNFARGKRS